jgi:creatinine amidohydrolase
MIAIPHDVFNVPNCEKQFLSPHEQRAMHAGHSETALMLALAPECVHMERRRQLSAAVPLPDPVERPPGGGLGFLRLWPQRRYRRPDPGDSGAGRRVLELAVSWAQAISEIHRMEWVERHEPLGKTPLERLCAVRPLLFRC